jgi:hypothetical protein
MLKCLKILKLVAFITFDVEKFDLKKLNYGKVKEQYSLNFLSRLAALENLNDNRDMNWASDIIREEIKFSVKQIPGYYDFKIHKSWLPEG